MTDITTTSVAPALTQDEALRRLVEHFKPQITAAQAPDIVEWAQRVYYIPETSQPIILSPGQRTYLRLANYHPCLFSSILYSTIKKCLALDTPVPTATGWTTMGDIEVGDIVFDEQGYTCNVVNVWPVYNDHVCYEVTFSDGTKIVADADHLWATDRLDNNGYIEGLRTTKEIAATLLRADGARRHRIPVAGALQTFEAELIVPPYVLGAWLGDGASAIATITVTEPEILASIRKYADASDQRVYGGRAATVTLYGQMDALRALDVINNKHIPLEYLRASYEQRLLLLQGLMDTDGYISKERGTSGCECEFTTVYPGLATTFRELLTTLGFKSTVVHAKSTLYGVRKKDRYRIKFHAPSSVPVFTLPRKLARQRSEHSYTMMTARSTNRHIVSVERVDTVPVRCIEVDSPSHLFLVGETMIATSNSGKTAIAGLQGRYMAEHSGNKAEVYFVAHDKEQAKDRAYESAKTSIELSPTYDKGRRTLAGKWRIIERQSVHQPTDSIMRAIASDYEGAAGGNPTLSSWTELWSFTLERFKRLWDELTPVPTRARSIRWVETYAGFEDESELLLSYYKLGMRGRRATIKDLEPYAYPLGSDPWPYADRDSIPIWINEDARMVTYWDTAIEPHNYARRMPWQKGPLGDAYYKQQAAELRPTAFDRLHRNLWQNSVSEFIPVAWWHACKRGGDAKPRYNKDYPVVLSIDASVSGDCTAIEGVSRHPDDSAIEVVDKKGNKISTSLHEIDIVHRIHRVWKPPSAGTIDYAEVESEIRLLCSEYNVVQLTYDVFQLHDMMQRLTRDGVVWCRQFSQASEREVADKALYDMIRDRHFWHDDEMPDEFIRNAAAYAAGAGSKVERMRIVKKSKDTPVDPTVALSMAVSECKRLVL